MQTKQAKTNKGIGLIKSAISLIIDILLIPFNFIIALYLRRLRINRFTDYPIAKKIFFLVGVYPVLDHYWEPMFNSKHLRHSLRKDRYLPGIDMNLDEQLNTLCGFDYGNELLQFPLEKEKGVQQFSYFEGPFPPGDSELLYSMVRKYRPRKFIEIGGGHSTLMVQNAIKQNKRQDSTYDCQHICIEPYENQWLEQLGIEIIRKKVEELDISFFKTLSKNDILFIDSSHIIRPQGDVLFEFLEILPILNEGVLVHFHDIFTPKDYLDEWIRISAFSNEQYLLEAFLTGNRDYKIRIALNYLRHNYYKKVSEKFPVLKMQVEIGAESEPGSFWIVRESHY